MTTTLATTTLALNSDYFSTLGRNVGAIACYAILGVVLILIGFYAIDVSTPGKLTQLVQLGRPNASVVAASGMVSMAFIVVLAIYSSGGKLSEGLISTAVYGLLGILAQAIGLRLLEMGTSIKIGPLLANEKLVSSTFVVAAGHLAIGLIVAVAIL
ncbi:MAG: DUF350 domain-containing protein [Mycobacteriaceae bacterium]